ncbi:P-loop containing nucleoside triphosphate hydrolase protein [Lobosporangium transversale]|uniref:p-loop containing nucleoside triphosphate hydrolase protein n=1 Tax=Lobosporangium transversale TaxID=64571 RepID=A0A1Y2GCD4_9FUNG|nr:P-loop containing nucleoside triphosphate hydrolase protein [Lobosporangium transversale]ORZ05117.1 P-loop containing nucleoside triphosphate hydrolase protein [Lobosporangium transversale]|eukprot:XP_021876892.1 P-loop containing nucleoside triphosphate hydrolase protein [Lobosporangium transversale]
MSQAIVKEKFGGKYRISQSIKAFPFEWSTEALKGYSLNLLSIQLFPFGLSVLLPTHVGIMVLEKENRHRMMMAMNGLKVWSYFLAHYFEFLTMQLIASFSFAVACVVVREHFIWRTSPWITFLLLLLWAHVQATMALVLSSIFSNTRKATMTVYFFVAVSCIMIGVSDRMFKDGAPSVWYIHPSFAFFEIMEAMIRHASRVNGLYPLVAKDFAPGTTLFKLTMMLVGESILFLILTFYLDAVTPSEYGIHRPWHFPITYWFKKSQNLKFSQESTFQSESEVIQDELEGSGDADAYAERERVKSVYQPSTTPLIIDKLFHQYPNKAEPALRGLSLGVENNTVLSLLGPNGAGKSTLIHLLTGLYSPTSGTAYVAGHNIHTDMSTVQSKMGVCPQYNILWDELTVADHLLFYSRLRGVPPSLEQQAVSHALACVSLTRFRNRAVSGLSGGEKRRVSIAIALLGDKQVIFLDEPSTGLDPEVRRVIWDVIQQVKVGRTIVLTTHSMEEADILSDRIAIMTTGQLRCVGTSLHLKGLYGTGFKLDVTSKPGRLEEACRSLEQAEGVLKGKKFRRVDKFTNATTFEFELGNATDGRLSTIFANLSQADRFPAIEDWGICQTTLEDVFLRIVTSGPSALAAPAIINHEPLET